MEIKKPFHTNDATIKYSSMATRKRQHQYFSLPGQYFRRYPTEVVLRNMETGRMDELYSILEKMLINLEEESGDVSEETLKKFSKYKTFASFIYAMPVITVVICHKDPKNFPKEYENSPTDILRPIYIYFTQKVLWEKYENIINKVNQNIELSDNEALDIAFIPRFISKKDGKFICETFAKLFKDANIPDHELKRDVAVILMTMILTHVPDEKEQNELLEVMEMDVYKDDMEELVYSVYQDELTKKDQEIKQKDNTIQQKDKEIKEIKKDYDNELQKLNKVNNLPQEARKIINTMLLLNK